MTDNLSYLSFITGALTAYDEVLQIIHNTAKCVYNKLTEHKKELDFKPTKPPNCYTDYYDVKVDQEAEVIELWWKSPDPHFSTLPFEAIPDPDKHAETRIETAKKRILDKKEANKKEKIKRKETIKKVKLAELKKLIKEFPSQAKELINK